MRIRLGNGKYKEIKSKKEKINKNKSNENKSKDLEQIVNQLVLKVANIEKQLEKDKPVKGGKK